MAIDTVKLINYLAYGVSGVQIASALALSEGRVSQLAELDNVKELVAARKAEISSEELDRKADLRTAASTLLGTIVELASETESIGEAVRAYEILDKLARGEDARDGERTRPGRSASTLIVQVPIFVQQALSLETNKVNEIVEIAGRSMATLPTSDTYKLLSAAMTKNASLNGEEQPQDQGFQEEW